MELKKLVSESVPGELKFQQIFIPNEVPTFLKYCTNNDSFAKLWKRINLQIYSAIMLSSLVPVKFILSDQFHTIRATQDTVLT